MKNYFFTFLTDMQERQLRCTSYGDEILKLRSKGRKRVYMRYLLILLLSLGVFAIVLWVFFPDNTWYFCLPILAVILASWVFLFDDADCELVINTKQIRDIQANIERLLTIDQYAKSIFFRQFSKQEISTSH